MKFSVLLLSLVVAAKAASGVTLFSWQESRDKNTGEKRIGFFLAPEPVRKVFEADAKGDTGKVQAQSAKLPKDAWIYGLMLTGEAKTYSKEKIALFEPSPCGSPLELDSGSIEMDRKSGTVRVALKVKQDGKVIIFVGNGLYPIKK